MSQFENKVGLIVGVANKRSIAWAIAQAASAEGASLILTYAGERLEENVRELAATLPNVTVLPCDVTDDAQIDALFAAIAQQHGGLDFMVHGAAFANRDDLAAPFVQTSREGFRLALDVSAYSLVALARRAEPLMAARGGGSIVTLSYLGAERVFTNYNVMG
ncbi:MAG: SDR family oxidoreductase, partial [Acidobacteria bacterium]|nr:SDR family oxidoreductase [Acidobacteriota bacterium]